ncbi:4a-hydroxytetrahydrobiopterin dehydratase [Marichromatium gracile]|uniref:4a-hydroxytetrahydrobiopterin dehydratase n=1 Tax=Marichromatium gracile TaxID=1048 RepID=A0A4R4ALI6_MARGR|nr:MULTISPECIES: 4a-hydroxytetrahydrobiopterin dehydratase [Marichromatium]MBO8087040.1 4a-hydroxytetrahydrobiopterin dehydratase [Marichromatium sp.]KXX65583.1 pterin-4-alpha-carbinolamine dehydratase [Marichromatium gracile]MBK1709603.1 pterin-4-alpha-carbinolamine dehydratase [Marichromatium gracile]MCF1183169.1 4a-hydroxytetrahydrobiopterin dehydratase [Marichromatium gracile]RNE88683.1 pterin-4-alpha-carbinolamine dehydratase [Marichromatium sp. AB31]
MNQSDWRERNRPARLERRLSFADYDHTRDFLEDMAGVSERLGYYPDISFGRTHVSITIHAEDGAECVDPARRALAGEVDALFARSQGASS